MPWVNFSVETNEGDIYPCCKSWSIHSYGNIFNYSFQEIWNSNVAQAHRAAMFNGNYKKFCRPTCPYLLKNDNSLSRLKQLETIFHYAQKSKQIMEEINKQHTLVSTQPILLQIITTSLCNLSCIMCSQEHKRKNHLPVSFYKYVENILPDLFRINLLGGELFFDKFSREFLFSLTKDKINFTKLGIVTNGVLIDEYLYGKTNLFSFDYIIVSLNAASAQTYKKIHGKDYFNRVTNNLFNLKEESSQLPLYASFVVQPDNYFEVEEFIDFCVVNNIGAKFVPVFYDSPTISRCDYIAMCNHIQKILKSKNKLSKDIINELFVVHQTFYEISTNKNHL